jgi:hypothetical protein
MKVAYMRFGVLIVFRHPIHKNRGWIAEEKKGVGVSVEMLEARKGFDRTNQNP